MTPEGHNANSWEVSEMAFDLRSRYAQIIGDILEEIARVRIAEQYPKLYTLLDHLHTEINQKLTKKEREEYIKEKKKCIEILNNNKGSYLGTNQKGEGKAAVYNALKELEVWLKDKMEAHKMFGGKSDTEGL